jgi:hypothetical protein
MDSVEKPEVCPLVSVSVSFSITPVSSAGDLTLICWELFLVVDATAAQGSPRAAYS